MSKLTSIARRLGAAAAGCGGAVALAVVLAAHPAAAQVTVLQDSCDATGDHPIVYFTLASSAGTPSPVCQMAIVPAQGPCFPLECGAPDGWTCFPGDITTFFQADAGACLAPGGSQGGFRVRIFTEPCCYDIHFMSADGTHLNSEKFCFDCGSVGVERQTWGRVKRLYE